MSERMEPRPDLDLVQDVRNGNRQAFTELMRRYQQRVYWVARRIVGSHDEADDVAQETFVKAFVALGDFRGDSSFFTWLYRIAVNISLNTVRRRQLVTYVRESELIQRFLPASEQPDAQLEQRETESALDRAVARLPEKQKAVFVMRYFEELTYEEISQVLKTSVGGLKANYFHAVHKVRESLRNEAEIHTDGQRGKR
jgi:RNA polymerase sigma-70 factor (ECF subfamily)